MCTLHLYTMYIPDYKNITDIKKLGRNSLSSYRDIEDTKMVMFTICLCHDSDDQTVMSDTDTHVSVSDVTTVSSPTTNKVANRLVNKRPH